MAYEKKSYLEHVALRVKDIEWHVRFFYDVLGMTVRDVQAPAGGPKQVWTLGGIQLIADPEFTGPEGRLAHLGIMVEDLDAAIAAAQAWGVSALPQGRNWFALADGLVIELLQAEPGSVAQALAVKSRPEP